MDIWLLPVVGRRAQCASRHPPSRGRPPPAGPFGTFWLQCSPSPQRAELAGPIFSQVFFRLFSFSFCSLITSGQRQGKEMPLVAAESHGMLRRCRLAFAKLFMPVPQLCERNGMARRKEDGPITPVPFLHLLNPKSLLSSHPVHPTALPGHRAVCFHAPSYSFASAWCWGNSNYVFASFFF